MTRPNRKCCVDGTEYYYCSHNCRESLNKPSWMASFCSENCRNVYNACAGYFGKNLTAQEARIILDKCDLSNKEHFTPATQRLIDEIYSEKVQEEKIIVREPVKVPVQEEKKVQLRSGDKAAEAMIAQTRNFTKNNRNKKKNK